MDNGMAPETKVVKASKPVLEWHKCIPHKLLPFKWHLQHLLVRSWALRATNIRDGHHTEDILGTIKRLLIPQLLLTITSWSPQIGSASGLKETGFRISTATCSGPEQYSLLPTSWKLRHAYDL
ncbi:uncharacterized protein LOC112880850 [Panicum hallii]|uniref:uncharacterized protein LOC112880850 n=1 Tax=Panicum hallii TaxID=206008 RepID=UPI000DF4E3F0|nr:uncharacterized protein LOC112880850 [Panicum hallii]